MADCHWKCLPVNLLCRSSAFLLLSKTYWPSIQGTLHSESEFQIDCLSRGLFRLWISEHCLIDSVYLELLKTFKFVETKTNGIDSWLSLSMAFCLIFGVSVQISATWPLRLAKLHQFSRCLFGLEEACRRAQLKAVNYCQLLLVALCRQLLELSDVGSLMLSSARCCHWQLVSCSMPSCIFPGHQNTESEIQTSLSNLIHQCTVPSLWLRRTIPFNVCDECEQTSGAVSGPFCFPPGSKATNLPLCKTVPLEKWDVC